MHGIALSECVSVTVVDSPVYGFVLEEHTHFPSEGHRVPGQFYSSVLPGSNSSCFKELKQKF